MPGDIPDVYLRFDGFTGECNDLKHPGDKGWITVKSFSFGFGLQGSETAADDDEDQQQQQQDQTGTQANPRAAGGTAAPRPPAPRRAKKKKIRAPMKSGPMTFDCISFSKASDVMSHSLMEACHDGTEIPKVELHACRYGGGPQNEKVPFLHLVFERVHLKTCKLNLATEGMPSEDVEFEYEKVEMKCMWTDNATGDPLTAQPITAGWDLSDQTVIDEEPDDE
jgi:type VI protein secretion system component Hcp